jgi:NAD(P)H-hydrate epimerase
MPEITDDILKKIYKERQKDARKYDFGLLVVIGGSEFYSGSPALSALAAFKTGVDMVRIIAPKRAADIIAGFSPNLAAFPLEGNYLNKKHFSVLLEMTDGAKEASRGKTAVVIGGGIGNNEEVRELVIEYLKQVSLPAVIDADAVKCLAKNSEVISGKNFLITPHSNEFFVLTGREVWGKSEEEKIKIVREEAERLKTTLLLKGPVDIISDGRETALNRTGSPYMTKGGTGDTLAGICGALIARGIDIFTAAQAGAYINGLAGELAAKKFGESLTATDLIEAISEAIRDK